MECMQQRGKHRKKNDDRLAKQFLIILLAIICLVQILMLNDNVRFRLSIVDQMEGQQIEFNKK